jgi:hypothetical protein
VPAGGRAFFRTRVPDAPSYRVSIEAIDWLRCGDG